MGKRSIAFCVAVMAIALVVVGCGSGGEETATAQIAKPAFLAKAGLICERAYERVEGEYDEFINDHGEDAFEDLDRMEEYTDATLIPAREQQLEEIRDLGAPPGDEKKVEAIVTAYEEGLEEAGEDPENAVNATYGPFVPATALIDDYGVDCRY